MRLTLLFILTILGTIACKNNETSKQLPAQNTNTTTQSVPAGTLPFIPVDIYKNLAETTTGIDVVPLGTTVTMDISEQHSCYQFIAGYILDTQVPEMSCTQPMGRIFFNKNGNSVMEADIYFTNKCQYLVFFESGNSKPMYATQLSDKGKDYFTKIYSKNAFEELKKMQNDASKK